MWKNRINGHMHIGCPKNIERRWKEHSRLPFSSKRKDEIEKIFYKAIKKYGVENFERIILKECSENELKEKECFYIKKYTTFLDKRHYNATPGGDGVSPRATLCGEQHGMAKLSTEEVIFCRKAYAKGLRSKDIWNIYFSSTITWHGFLRMWHGKTWKGIMPEVFKHNPHKSVYTKQDRDIITTRFLDSGLNRHQFALSNECFVGEATLYNMLDNPQFYENK